VKQRLQKVLSRAGIASRRAAERLIEEGRVEVDGIVVTELGSSADPSKQDVRVDGRRVRPQAKRRYIALNKPRGYVTTRSDPSRRRTVMELLPPAYQTLFPVGRLDMASTGLLLLTDDGELAQQLTHPRYGIAKTYLVTVTGSPTRGVLERATRGVFVDKERLVLDEVTVVGAPREPRGGSDRERKRTRLRVVLRQGKNREIRRLFRALGHPVQELHRERVGSLSVRGIPRGGFRKLTSREVDRLRRDVGVRRGASRSRRAGSSRAVRSRP
jgi:23S rRNA pseudouridine2605 synthase